MSRTIVQRVDFDPRLEVAGLYRRYRKGTINDAQPMKSTADGLHVPAGVAATFDTYFNAFFENYWFGYTSLASVILRVAVRGNCVLSVWRQSPERDRYLLTQEVVQDDAQFEFEIRDDDELRVEPGRLWFEVEALSDTVIESADWSTFDEPRREVQLGVVFCTFNREQYLQRILRAIDDDDRAHSAVTRVFVVNQGAAFTEEEILGSGHSGRLSKKLALIEQPNLGGCGGFTRGMHETVIAEDLTHFLLMDDDSRVNAESIARAAGFLSYCDDDVVVGGHMLNLHRPQRLFEAGAMLDDSSLQPTPIHHDVDLVGETGLEPFLRAGAVSYNGWWMFGAPASIVERIGYPMPCFIRGDDMEYGLRLSDAQIRTVPVPGIAVWHEPFYLKLGGWQFFFEVRNRLVMAALHDHPDFGGIRSDLRKVFARDIAMCRYHSCKLMMAGISAYAEGPDVALDTTDGPLRAAAQLVAEYGPTKVDGVIYAASESEDLAERGELRRLLATVQTAAQRRVGKVMLAAQLARRLLVAESDAGSREPAVRARDLKPHVVAKHDRYMVVEEHADVAWRFQRDRALERELWRESRALFERIAPDERYKEAFEATNRFEDSWHQILSGLDEGGAETA